MNPITAHYPPYTLDEDELTDYEIAEMRVEFGLTFAEWVDRLERFVKAARAGEVVA